MDGRFMRRFALSPLKAILVLMLTAVAPQQAFGPPPTQAGQVRAAQYPRVPLDLFQLPEGLEVTVWARLPC